MKTFPLVTAVAVLDGKEIAREPLIDNHPGFDTLVFSPGGKRFAYQRREGVTKGAFRWHDKTAADAKAKADAEALADTKAKAKADADARAKAAADARAAKQKK